MKRYLPFFVLLLAGALGASAQPTPTLVQGDVLVTRIRIDEPGFDVRTATIEVLARDGTFKGILAALPGREFSDLFYRNGISYVAARRAACRLASSIRELALASSVTREEADEIAHEVLVASLHHLPAPGDVESLFVSRGVALSFFLSARFFGGRALHVALVTLSRLHDGFRLGPAICG